MAAITTFANVNKGCESSSDGSCSTHGTSGCGNGNSFGAPVDQCNQSGNGGTCSTCGASSPHVQAHADMPKAALAPPASARFRFLDLPIQSAIINPGSAADAIHRVTPPMAGLESGGLSSLYLSSSSFFACFIPIP
ncbi:hypothetical protein IAT40_000766 [Kwoniella sp. CBS 6097]